MTVLRTLHTAYIRLMGAALLAAAAALLAARAGALEAGAVAPAWAIGMAGLLALAFRRPIRATHGLHRPRRRMDAAWIVLHALVCALLPHVLAPLAPMPLLAPLPVRAFDPALAAIVPSLLVPALIVRNRPGGRALRRPGWAMDRRARGAAAQAGPVIRTEPM